MILSKPELQLLEALKTVDGPMPLRCLRPKYRSVVPRLRGLGLLYRRDPKWVRLTKTGSRPVVGSPKP
jgi:hypothetical protein